MTAPARSGPVTVHVSWQPYAALALGLLAVSSAAILIRLAQDDGAPSLVLAAARLSVAALVLTPFALGRQRAELRALRPSDLRWAMVSGVMLGVHFATWISSLEYTAVVNSVTIVTTNPLWVALLSPFVLGEKLNRWVLLGLALALCGGVMVGLSGEAGDPPTRNDPWLGNLLALIGALVVAIYFMIGRSLRARLSVVTYAWLVYGAAAIVLVGAVLVAGQPVGGFPARVYVWMLLLGLVPQLVGHSSFNYALGYLPAAFVSLIVLGEPIGSGVLAILLLDEWPVALQLVGAALILSGIALASRANRPPRAAPVGD